MHSVYVCMHVQCMLYYSCIIVNTQLIHTYIHACTCTRTTSLFMTKLCFFNNKKHNLAKTQHNLAKNTEWR